MKILKKQIYAGISGKYNKDKGKYDFIVDFEHNSEDDIVKFIEPYFQRSMIDNNTYWFGYSFNDGQSTPRRDEFIEFIKHVQPEKLVDPEDEWSGYDYDDEHLTQSDLDSMIIRSLDRIKLNNYSVDTIIYPESKSGNLVQMIVRCITRVIRSINLFKKLRTILTALFDLFLLTGMSQGLFHKFRCNSPYVFVFSNSCKSTCFS